jgi:CRISPR-associated protein Cmr1
MKILEYQVNFTTPAFLGNAEQQAQWRAPPFKALIRQWWRVVKGPRLACPFDIAELRREEAALFGAAADGGESRRSRVQLRLSSWEMGALTQLPRMATHTHPEAKHPKTGELIPVGTAVYLGFGPVTLQGSRPAIAPGELANTLRIRVPDEHADDIRQAMQLAAWFGTLGSRSRNGWGALHMAGEEVLDFGQMTDVAVTNIAPSVSLEQALRRDWPHALGQTLDGRLAIWRVAKLSREGNKLTVAGFDSWREVMEELARIKIKFRTDLKFPQEPGPHAQVQRRHVLAFPVTNHGLSGVKPDKRLATSLRFKVVTHKNKFFGVIAHLPCAMPNAFFAGSAIAQPPLQFQADVWRQVHVALDNQFPNTVTRIKRAAA